MDTADVVIPTVTIATPSARTHAQKDENDDDHPVGKERGEVREGGSERDIETSGRYLQKILLLI